MTLHARIRLSAEKPSIILNDQKFATRIYNEKIVFIKSFDSLSDVLSYVILN